MSFKFDKVLPSLLVAMLTGCAAQNQNAAVPRSNTAQQQLSTPRSSTQPMDEPAPFMIHEAGLPVGFPPPGPIDQVIVKTYPASRVATVAAVDVAGKGQDRLFMPLFDYIQKQKIAMTSPVVMDFAATADSSQPATLADPHATPPIAMSFLYRSPSIGRTGKAGIIAIHDLPAVTVLSVGVRGRYDGEHFVKGMKAINDWLAAHPGTFEPAGTPRFLGYNSPFVPWFFRYGEVQLPVHLH